MWTRPQNKPNGAATAPAPGNAVADSSQAFRRQPSPKDLERIDKILASISIDTSQTFHSMLESLTSDAPPRPSEGNQTRDYILATFDEIRQENNRDAIILARKFAEMCMKAADQLNDNHQRTVARCVSELFEQFAAKLDRREAANSN